MITLTLGLNSEFIVLTLKEKSTLENPTYRLSCENVTTKQIITFELGTDLSPYKDRYNEFEVNTSELFNEPGQYQYTAYENISNVVVEVGKLLVNKNVNFEFDAYQTPTSYIAYGG